MTAQGTVRPLTLGEIAHLVRQIREERGLKQAALAALAHVSEKTIERIESGCSISVESRERICAALGLRADALTGAIYIPTEQELGQAIADARDTLERENVRVTLDPVTDPRQVLALLACEALLVDDSRLSAEHVRPAAVLKAALHDWADIAADIPETARLEAAIELQHQFKAIEALGYRALTTTRRRSWTTPTGPLPFELGVVVFVDRAQSSNEYWLPKKMRGSF